jgi:hypothetical protein
MTEAEWLESISVPAMLRFLRGKVSDEQLRHFIRASAALVWPDLVVEWGDDSKSRYLRLGGQALLPPPTLFQTAENVNWFAVFGRSGGSMTGEAQERGRQAQASLLREIVGNPFHSLTVDPRWLTWNGGTVSKMARAIHNQRAFDRLPILADALEEAGCTDRDILDHCRGPNEHVPGCWVLGLLLSDE